MAIKLSVKVIAAAVEDIKTIERPLSEQWGRMMDRDDAVGSSRVCAAFERLRNLVNELSKAQVTISG